MQPAASKPLVAIACGGTGGHLFPGVAVGEALLARGVDVTLLISPKEVDQQAVRTARGMGVATLPAMGLSGRNYLGFALGAWRSYRAAKKLFRQRAPRAVLAMGGFTSAPPVLGGRSLGAATFLHESNTIPGRANRWLTRFVDGAFVYFPETAPRLRHRSVRVVGMPVRPQFAPRDPAPARRTRGLDPARPTLLVMGGSQGASGVNNLLLLSLARLHAALPELQFIHLAGTTDAARVQAAYDNASLPAAVYPFLAEMDVAMKAATVAISRAGASSLAETAAMRLPSILIPYPTAADDHQRHNARAFADTGAARLLEQATATPDQLVAHVVELVQNQTARAAMQNALARWHTPGAAECIAEEILKGIGVVENSPARASLATSGSGATVPVAPVTPSAPLGEPTSTPSRPDSATGVSPVRFTSPRRDACATHA